MQKIQPPSPGPSTPPGWMAGKAGLCRAMEIIGGEIITPPTPQLARLLNWFQHA